MNTPFEKVLLKAVEAGHNVEIKAPTDKNPWLELRIGSEIQRIGLTMFENVAPSRILVLEIERMIQRLDGMTDLTKCYVKSDLEPQF
jgi:hypothetical protein